MTNRPLEVALSRDLGLFDVTMIGVGAMIGAGIFVLTGIAAGVAGPGLVLAFLLNGVVASLTAMAYAELASGFPEAGGGYLWVKEALGGLQGFLGGWMSWFAHAVAGSLYALGFGRFAAELVQLATPAPGGLSVGQLSWIFTLVVVIAFTIFNYRGASETGMIGNAVTFVQVATLLLFAGFGLVAMAKNPAWTARFTTDFLPKGWTGVTVAMGLTFIAFEGYEIIAQSGEEVRNPRVALPRAIFMSIASVVIIYVLVALVAIGAVRPPPGMASYEFLGQQREVAIAAAAAQLMPLGSIILPVSALAATMSALNATTYSSSRVAFAMGRDHNLPPALARVHPVRHTPHWAVVASGVFIGIMALSLPLERVAVAADLMFLALFIQVNVSVMRLRLTRPDLDRGFRTPLFPAVPILAILSMLALTLFLTVHDPAAALLGIVWIGAGAILYLGHFREVEQFEKPRDILLEEVLVSRDYAVLVPVATAEQARILGRIGAVLARAHEGEVLALHVARVPPQLTLGEGRMFLQEGRGNLETVIAQAKVRDVPVHTMIRIGRDVARAVRDTAEERAVDIIVLGWPGYTNSAGRALGSVIDPIVDNPPADIAVVRYRKYRPLRSILVPIAGGPNSRRAARMAATMAAVEGEGAVRVVGLQIVPPGSGEAGRARAAKTMAHAVDGIDHEFEFEIVEGDDVAAAILLAARGHDMIVIGATDEPLFRNLLLGNIPEEVARRAEVTTIMVKRRSGPVKSLLRTTVLSPTTGDRVS